MDEVRGLGPAEALAKSTLIRDTNDEFDDWEIWLEAADATGAKPARELRFDDYSMAVTAAIDGHGIVWDIRSMSRGKWLLAFWCNPLICLYLSIRVTTSYINKNAWFIPESKLLETG